MEFLALLLLLLAATSQATPPVATSTRSQLKTLSVGDMVLRAYIITVEFDQPIFVQGVPVTSRNLTVAPPSPNGGDGNCNGGGGGDGGFPPVAMLMDGKLQITCGALDWRVDMARDRDGPPASILTTVTTADPGSSFMAFMSGFAPPEAVNPNAISFLKLISAGGGGQMQLLSANTTEDAVRTCGSKRVSIAPGVITNAGGESVSADAIIVAAPPSTPPCDYESISSFKRAFDYVADMAARLAVDATLYQQFSFLQGALDSRDALSACRALVDPMLTTETVTRRLNPTRQCVYRDGTAEWAQSPCCNHALQFTQCCAPVAPVANLTVVRNVTLDRIVGQCSHPDRVILALYSYINAANAVATAPESQQALSERFGKFQNACQNLVYGKKCSADADCRYSQSCDVQQGQCKVPWGADAELMLSCYYDEFDPGMRAALAGLWSVPDSDKAALVGRMRPLLLTDDCIGNNAWNLQTRCTYENGCEKCTPANQTSCLAPKSCNWNMQIRSDADCVAVSAVDPSPNFCGQCWGDGSSCWSQSSPDLCLRDFYTNENACRTANLTWHVTPWQYGMCVDATRRSRAECLPQAACPQLSPDGRNCESWGSHVCYAPNVTADECQAASAVSHSLGGVAYNLQWQSWRNNGDGVCAFNRQWSPNPDPFTASFCASFEPAVANKPVAFFPGGAWSEGQFNTQTKCQAGRCNWQDPAQAQSGQDLAPAQCAQKQMCSQPCARCRASQWVGPGVTGFCYAAGGNVTGMDDCSRKSGQWSENVVGSAGRCLFTQPAAVQSPSACAAYGASVGVRTQFASCDALGADTCADPNDAAVGELGPWLKCYWDMHAPCRNATECVQSGRCNDDDKQQWRANGPPIPGACLVDNAAVNEYGWPTDCSTIRSRSLPPTNQTLGYSRYPMKCVDPTATNATACARVAGEWKAKATSRSACLADVACYDEGSNWPNGKSAAQCSLCAGSVAPIYDWTPGRWVNASMDPLSWKAKQFASQNQWGKRIDHSAVWNALVNPAINYHLAASVYGGLTARYSVVSDLFRLISCDCTAGRDARNCFGDVQASPIAAAVLQKGRLNKIETPLGVIRAELRDANATAAPGGRRLLADSGGSVSITVAQVTAQTLAELGPGNVPDYRVVRAAPGADDAVVVGQLVGDGMRVAGFTPDLTQVSVTLYLSQGISPDAVAFPVPWIAYLLPNTTRVYPLLGVDVKAENGSLTTANITRDGTFFPVYLQATWRAMLQTRRASATTSAQMSGSASASASGSASASASGSASASASASASGSASSASANQTVAPLDNGSPASTAPAPGPTAATPTPASTATPAPTTGSVASRQPHPLLALLMVVAGFLLS